MPPGSASGFEQWSQQWYCKQDGECVDKEKDSEYGFPITDDALLRISEEVKRVVIDTERRKTCQEIATEEFCETQYPQKWEAEDSQRTIYYPKWKAQRLRTVVPCAGTEEYEWRRTGQVVTLGVFSMALGSKYSVKSIYHFYRTLCIVTVKRAKNATLNKHRTPGSASVMEPGAFPMRCRVGTTGTILQPSRQLQALRTNKKQLIKEYASIMHFDDFNPTDEKLFKEAVRYLQICLLSDLRPPWADYYFHKPLPGSGILSSHISPAYLYWTGLDAHSVFGTAVMDELARVASRFSLEVMGVLGRPLYVCTAPKCQPQAPVSDSAPGWFCLSTAAMSPLLQLSSERKHYMCAKCTRDRKEPHYESAPLRVVHLYVTVLAEDRNPTTMRMKAVPVVLDAPPMTFGWNLEPGTASVEKRVAYAEAVPIQFEIRDKLGSYKYDVEASEAIWSSAQSFRVTSFLILE